jgi:glycosyltransferase involved in cell wall biosynthesis
MREPIALLDDLDLVLQPGQSAGEGLTDSAVQSSMPTSAADARSLRRVIMLGFLVEPDYFRKYSQGDPFPQVAAYKLEERYVAGLRQAGVTVDVIGSAAVSSFPRNRHWFLPSKNWSTQNDVRWVLPSFNIPLLKMPMRMLLAVGALISRLRGRSRGTAICVYAAHSPWLVAALIASRLFGVQFFVIIPDLPRYMRLEKKQNPLVRWVRALDARLIDTLVVRSSGVSVVTKNMVSDTPAWTNLRYFVIEGLSRPPVRSESPVAVRARPYFMYAGLLSRSNGVQSLIEAFRSTRIDADLLLCGRGELEEFIAGQAREDARVVYGGFLDQATLADLQSRALAQVLIRDPSDAYTRYSFPSKLIEYMAGGVPVLTTRLPGIPEEYFQYLTAVDGPDPASVVRALETFMAQSQSELKERAAAGRNFILNRCDPDRAMLSFIQFMESSG